MLQPPEITQFISGQPLNEISPKAGGNEQRRSRPCWARQMTLRFLPRRLLHIRDPRFTVKRSIITLLVSRRCDSKERGGMSLLVSVSRCLGAGWATAHLRADLPPHNNFSFRIYYRSPSSGDRYIRIAGARSACHREIAQPCVHCSGVEPPRPPIPRRRPVWCGVGASINNNVHIVDVDHDAA